MAALWGFFIIAFAVLSQVVGVTVSPLHLEGLIYRKQDPSSRSRSTRTAVHHRVVR